MCIWFLLEVKSRTPTVDHIYLWGLWRFWAWLMNMLGHLYGGAFAQAIALALRQMATYSCWANTVQTWPSPCLPLIVVAYHKDFFAKYHWFSFEFVILYYRFNKKIKIVLFFSLWLVFVLQTQFLCLKPLLLLVISTPLSLPSLLSLSPPPHRLPLPPLYPCPCPKVRGRYRLHYCW